ncbi:HYC_CC_PP family protein [Roseivirga echinicomitans]
MKKSVTILFTLLYMFASTGMLVGQHICMGSIKEAALLNQQKKECTMSADMHKSMKDCCQDEWSLTKIEDNQQASALSNIPNANYHLLYEVPYSTFLVLLDEQEEKVEVKNTGPPDIPKPELYIAYHSLKIPSAL